MKIGLATAFALLLASAAGAQPSRDESLRAFMAASFAEIREGSPDAAYVATFVDLNGDGRDEALVQQSAGFFCGSGGCALYIYTPQGASWRQVEELTVGPAPVLLLGTSSNGWRDLAAHVRDGGMDLPYQVRMRFNGNTYGGSPEMRARLRRRVDGRILIADGMPVRRLFP